MTQPFRAGRPAAGHHELKAGDYVEWNSEAGRVRGRIIRKITSPIVFKGYRRHASTDEPQYLIKSDTTDHVAIHKGAALKKVRGGGLGRPRRKPKRAAPSRRAPYTLRG